MFSTHRADIVHQDHGSIGSLAVIEIDRKGTNSNFLDALESHSSKLGHLDEIFRQNGQALDFLGDHRGYPRFGDAFHRCKMASENDFWRGNKCWDEADLSDSIHQRQFFLEEISFLKPVGLSLT